MINPNFDDKTLHWNRNSALMINLQFDGKSMISILWFIGLLGGDLVAKWRKRNNHSRNNHWVNSVRIRSFSGPYFPSFGLNTERYEVPLRVQSECGTIRTRRTPKTENWILRREHYITLLISNFYSLWNYYKTFGRIDKIFIWFRIWIRYW